MRGLSKLSNIAYLLQVTAFRIDRGGHLIINELMGRIRNALEHGPRQKSNNREPIDIDNRR